MYYSFFASVLYRRLSHGAEPLYMKDKVAMKRTTDTQQW